MNKDMIELYSDYLIASFGQTTATGLANLLGVTPEFGENSTLRNLVEYF